MKYAGFAILAIGACIVYLSKLIMKKIKKTDEVTDKMNLQCKLVGLVVSLVGVALIFI